MPERTIEELEQIRADFILIKQVYDEKLEWKLDLPNPFDGKSREREIKDFWDNVSDVYKELLSSEKIESCEALTFINNAISECNWEGQNPDWEDKYIGSNINPSWIYKPVDDLSLDKMVELLKENPLSKRLNQNLDKIGIHACKPIALNEADINIDKIKIASDISINPNLPELTKGKNTRSI